MWPERSGGGGGGQSRTAQAHVDAAPRSAAALDTDLAEEAMWNSQQRLLRLQSQLKRVNSIDLCLIPNALASSKDLYLEYPIGKRVSGESVLTTPVRALVKCPMHLCTLSEQCCMTRAKFSVFTY